MYGKNVPLAFHASLLQSAQLFKLFFALKSFLTLGIYL